MIQNYYFQNLNLIKISLKYKISNVRKETMQSYHSIWQLHKRECQIGKEQ